MESRKENNYQICYENLCREFVKYVPEDVAKRSKAYYDPEKKQFTLTYFNKEYLISYPNGDIVLKDDTEKDLSMDENRMLSHKMLILSYLFRATNSIPTNKWVPYRELEGVGHAYQCFAQQGIDKLVSFFAYKGELFLKAGLKLGGKKIDSGDVGIEITVLPNVRMRFILWLADDEFEANATILYDYSVTKELHVEDLGELCYFAADNLIEVAKEISD